MNHLLLVALLATSPVQITLYDVQGMTPAQIRESINEARPSHRNGTRWDAIATWSVTWKYKTVQSPFACSVQSFEVALQSSVTLPRLTNEPPPPVKEKWRKYLAALTEHEDGHLQFGTSAAKAVQEAGNRMRERRTCQELRRDLDATAKQILNEYRHLEIKYDQETDHGLTQGARFP